VRNSEGWRANPGGDARNDAGGLFHSCIETERLPNPKDIVVHCYRYANDAPGWTGLRKLMGNFQGDVSSDDIEGSMLLYPKSGDRPPNPAKPEPNRLSTMPGNRSVAARRIRESWGL
jgi:hypothetical protein